MKRAATGVLLALVMAATGWGQQSIIDQLTFKAQQVSPVSMVTAQETGAPGTVPLYYWVIARYPIGVSRPFGPAVARTTHDVANLAAFPVNITWRAVAGATGYDVIRQTTGVWPATNACANCVVSSNQAGVTFTDNGGGVVGWPTAGTILGQSFLITTHLNNQDADYPYLITDREVHWQATRSTKDFAYLFEIMDNGGSTSGQMTGGAVQKTYGLGINLNRPTSAVATGDSNDALLKMSYNNYAKNDANFIVRGINTVVNNRSPGTLGMLDNLISVSSKSGSTSPIVNGLTVNAENFGTNATQHSAIDASIKNEGAKATLEFGVRVRNIDNSTANAADAAFLVASSAGYTNHGWLFGLDMLGATIGTAEVRTSAGPLIYSGNGAPAAGLCAAGTLGSVYFRSAGGAGSSLYVCEVAGAWQAK